MHKCLTFRYIKYLCVAAVWSETLKFTHRLVDPERMYGGANEINTSVLHVLSVLEVAPWVISDSHVLCIKSFFFVFKSMCKMHLAV